MEATATGAAAAPQNFNPDTFGCYASAIADSALVHTGMFDTRKGTMPLQPGACTVGRVLCGRGLSAARKL